MPTSRSKDISEAAALRYAVQRLSRRLRRQAEYGLTASQVSALATVERHSELRLGELGRREQVGKSTLTRLVAKLEDAGYMMRSVDPEDGRGYVLKLTNEGGRVLHEASERQDVYLLRQLEALSDGDRATLNAAVQVIEKLLDVRA